MVVSGMALQSHLGQSFKRIQHESGDEAAFIYLAANADGFHVTPYGFCTNSFSVNPCTRHLKCFDQCKHFTASGVAEHRVTFEDLRSKLVAMRDAARCASHHRGAQEPDCPCRAADCWCVGCASRPTEPIRLRRRHRPFHPERGHFK